MFREILRYYASTRAAFVFIIGIAMIPGIAASVAGMSYLQQTYFPVMADFTLDEAAYDVNGDIVLSGSFVKNYPDWACEYRDMNWYMPTQDSKGREVRFRVGVEFKDQRPRKSNNNRHAGMNFFHGWEVGVSEYPEMRNLTGYVSHRCLLVVHARTKFPLIRLPIRHVPDDSN